MPTLLDQLPVGQRTVAGNRWPSIIHNRLDEVADHAAIGKLTEWLLTGVQLPAYDAKAEQTRKEEGKDVPIACQAIPYMMTTRDRCDKTSASQHMHVQVLHFHVQKILKLPYSSTDAMRLGTKANSISTKKRIVADV